MRSATSGAFNVPSSKEAVIDTIRTEGHNRGVEERFLDAMIAQLEPAIQLVPKADSQTKIGGTRAGGLPDLPKSIPWPMSAGVAADPEPMPFILQVNLADVSPFDLNSRLPKTGLLSFFFYTIDEDSGEEARVIYTPEPLRNLRPRDCPEEVPDEHRYHAINLEPRLDWSMPSSEDINIQDFEAWSAMNTAVARIQGLFPYQGDGFQLLGHPHFVQPYSRPSHQELLLQVSPNYSREPPETTGMAWGDGGNVYILMNATDLSAREFERIHVMLDMC